MQTKNASWLTLLCCGALVMASVTIMIGTSAMDDPKLEEVGHWCEVEWGFNFHNAALLPSGEVLLWHQPSWCDSLDPEQRWIPPTNCQQPGSFTSASPPQDHNNNCVGFSHMADGRLLIVGGSTGCGDGLHQTTIFDWSDGTWSQAKNMHKGRWYPSATTLGDGRILVTYGTEGVAGQGHPAQPIAEIYDPQTGEWTESAEHPDGDSTNQAKTYPQMFLLVDGRAFMANFQDGVDPHVLDLNADPPIWLGPQNTWPAPLSGCGQDHCRYVMYEPGKFLRVRGSGTQDGTIKLDSTDSSPEWQTFPNVLLQESRQRYQVVLMPNGYALVVGGLDASGNNPVYEAEWIDPRTLHEPGAEWELLEAMEFPRTNTHSLALLLPDARVLSATGGGNTQTGGDAEIFSPPYLFDENNQEVDRPIILQAPGQVTYDTEFRISIDTSNGIGVDDLDLEGTVAVLMGLPANTHRFDQNQRYVPLDIVSFSVEDSWISVKSPPNGNHAPPGYYMLFVLTEKDVVNKHNVPSIAKFIRLVIDCPGCPGDLNDDGRVGIEDLLELLSCWGPVASGCEDADLNGDGDVDLADLLMLLAAWGPCATCGGESVPLTLEDCWERYHDDIERYEQCVEWVNERETYFSE